MSPDRSAKPPRPASQCAVLRLTSSLGRRFPGSPAIRPSISFPFAHSIVGLSPQERAPEKMRLNCGHHGRIFGISRFNVLQTAEPGHAHSRKHPYACLVSCQDTSANISVGDADSKRDCRPEWDTSSDMAVFSACRQQPAVQVVKARPSREFKCTSLPPTRELAGRTSAASSEDKQHQRRRPGFLSQRGCREGLSLPQAKIDRRSSARLPRKPAPTSSTLGPGPIEAGDHPAGEHAFPFGSLSGGLA